MTFQFTCPNNHLLEGDPSQAGLQTICPECQTPFMIPHPPQQEIAMGETPSSFADPHLAGGADQFNPFGQPAAGDSSGEQILHIPCPQGHLLETPLEMLNQTVLCPHCGEQFELKKEKSVEYQKRKAAAEAHELRRKSKLWLNWAIGVGVVVFLFLISLFIIAAS